MALEELQQAALSRLRTDIAAGGDLMDALLRTGGPAIGEWLAALVRGTEDASGGRGLRGALDRSGSAVAGRNASPASEEGGHEVGEGPGWPGLYPAGRGWIGSTASSHLDEP